VTGVDTNRVGGFAAVLLLFGGMLLAARRFAGRRN
jgi:hypothetical protein